MLGSELVTETGSHLRPPCTSLRWITLGNSEQILVQGFTYSPPTYTTMFIDERNLCHADRPPGVSAADHRPQR